MFVFPLQVGAIRVGALSLHRRDSGLLSPAELAEALSYAEALLLYVLQQQAREPVADTVGPLLDAGVRSTAQVHQATGMVAVQASVGLVEALLLLRAHAFGSGRSVAAVAADVVAHILRFDGAVSDDP